jgi:hypothetical protein
VLWTRTDGNSNDKITATFPYDLVGVWDPAEPEAAQWSKRASLVRALIEDCLLHPIPNPGGTPVGTPPGAIAGVRSLNVSPNPFNPTTIIRFELGASARTTVAVYDLRGGLVVQLHDGMLAAGPQRMPWNGRDHRGRAVASGVYVVEIEGGGQRHTAKIALLK